MLRNPSSCHYRFLSIAKRTWAGLPMSTNLRETSYNSLLVVVNRFTKISKPMQTIDAPQFSQLDCPQLRVLVPPVPLSSLTAITTYASSIKTSRNLMTACRKNFNAGLWHSKSLSPDLWGYMHGFSYWFDLWISYVWQISLRQTFEFKCMDLTINQRRVE